MEEEHAMDENLRKELRRTIVTIATSVAAAAMGAILTFLSWKKGEFSVVGVIIMVAMAINVIPAAKRRRQILDEVNGSPKL